MRLRLGLLLAMGLLAACGRATGPATLPPPATLQPLFISYQPAVGWMMPAMSTCADAQPDIAIYPSEAISFEPLGGNDMWISWGEPPEGFSTYRLGRDSLQIVATRHAKEPRSDSDIADLFSGRTTQWADGSPVQVWVYVENAPMWQVFARALNLPVQPSESLIAPDPSAMLVAVSSDPNAIGILPSKWVDESVRTVQLSEKLAEKFRQPITATLLEAPEGGVLSWLVCLQSLLKP